MLPLRYAFSITLHCSAVMYVACGNAGKRIGEADLEGNERTGARAR